MSLFSADEKIHMVVIRVLCELVRIVWRGLLHALRIKPYEND